MNLAGLGYIAGGLSQGMDAGTKRALEQLQIQAQQQSLSGQKDAGTALMSMNGVQPQQQPQGGLGALSALLGGGKPPQQPGAPMQLQGAMPQQAPPQMAQAQPMQPPGAQPQAPQGQPQGGGVPPQLQAAAQHLDFSTLTNTLAKAPGMTPERLMAALAALSPYMNMQSQNDYKMAMLQVQKQNADSHSVTAGAAKENADTNAATKPVTAGAAKENADTNKGKADETARHHKETEDATRTRLEQGQQKLDEGKKHLDAVLASKDISSAELNFRALQKARADALMLSSTGENDPIVKGIDAQIQYAQTHLDRLRSVPLPRQDWEGKDKGRAEPLVATPAPEKPKGKVSVDGGEPDMSKAKRASDGKIYVPDPARPGKYLRVEE